MQSAQGSHKISAQKFKFGRQFLTLTLTLTLTPTLTLTLPPPLILTLTLTLTLTPTPTLTRFVRQFLSTGTSVLMTDIDVVYLQNPFLFLHKVSLVSIVSVVRSTTTFRTPSFSCTR